jgi:hypothetical protein
MPNLEELSIRTQFDVTEKQLKACKNLWRIIVAEHSGIPLSLLQKLSQLRELVLYDYHASRADFSHIKGLEVAIYN